MSADLRQRVALALCRRDMAVSPSLVIPIHGPRAPTAEQIAAEVEKRWPDYLPMADAAIAEIQGAIG